MSFKTQANGLELLSNVIDKAINEPTIHERHRAKYIIDVNEKIPPPPVAISMENQQKDGFAIIGTLGNFSLIIGKAKAKKSFYINIAIATALSNDLVLERFKGYLPSGQRKVLYFDTEQSKQHVQLAVRRICIQIDQPEPENLTTFFLRSLTPSERLLFIENEIRNTENLGFVVIDGIKDLITSINDEEQANVVVSKLLKWTEERNIHIVTVLHQNKSDLNARGHIGTELINKAETVLEVAKADNDSRISIVTPQQCRNIEPEVFAFEINELGIPIIAENYEARTETKKNKFDVAQMENFKKFQLLTEIFSKGESFTYSELVLQLGLAYKKQFNGTIGTNRAKELLTDCKNNNWLLQELNGKPYTLGTFKEHEI